MSRRAKRTLPSPLELVLELLAAKWTIPLLHELAIGARRFGELEKTLAGVSPRTLALRLTALEKVGIVRRSAFKEVPPRVEYALTEDSRDLLAIIERIAAWSVRT